MQFFKGILKEQPGAKTAVQERRGGSRLSVTPEFPLKSSLGFIGRDENGEELGAKRQNWNWKGRLIDCSEIGARLQLGPSVRAVKGEACDLKLSLDGFDLTVPSRIVNLRDQDEGVFCGLQHEIAELETEKAYAQFLEIVALGATLKPGFKKSKPDESGYLPEQYASDWQSCLNVWRGPSGKDVEAFEFVLKDCLVRAVKDYELECLVGTTATETKRATGYRLWEIKRLFGWVVPNLPKGVPPDVKEFLLRYAA